ncbi:MAG: porin family protein [Acidobacteriota bacterium]
MRNAHQTAAVILGLAVLTAFGVAPTAQAQTPFYLLGKLGDNSLDGDLEGAFQRVADGDSSSWGVGLGFKLNEYAAFQLEYNDLGNFIGTGGECGVENPCTTGSAEIESVSSMISATFLPHLPLGDVFSLYGKVGLVRWDSEVSEILDIDDIFVNDRDGWDVVYGAGLRVEIPGPLDAFAEYERSADSFENVSIGATFGF